MVGDWCRSGHGLPMQITNVGDDYAYATFEGNEGEPWEFDDKDYTPEPILLTKRRFMKKYRITLTKEQLMLIANCVEDCHRFACVPKTHRSLAYGM